MGMLDRLLNFLDRLTRRLLPGDSCIVCDAVAIPTRDVCPECIIAAHEMVFWETDSLDPFMSMSDEEFEATVHYRETTT